LDVLWNEMYEWYNITTTNSFIPNQYSNNMIYILINKFVVI
jgi:hypothetical protein